MALPKKIMLAEETWVPKGLWLILRSAHDWLASKVQPYRICCVSESRTADLAQISNIIKK
jgi:hypothetical protein